MKRLHKTITAILALLISAPSDVIRLLSKRPAVLPHPVEMQHPAPVGDAGERQQVREQEHTDLESAEPKTQERPALSIAPPPAAVPFVPDDDAWQLLLMTANTQRNQQYVFGYMGLD